ncbi:ABC transporter type 1, transmembrane domain-containing protein [Jimgerdemannia flammicorona]|uniref:ABC transporter type 1, transmembrane domain-containing protein n=1 Tax=Jimgerdemannia flammicorona TaxID=994334 RepID=A0A433DLM5_9FUNG|nr:ABC transporter type 1, transmembrane domain-containing protein [Jimgerdemannia flammicorona]
MGSLEASCSLHTNLLDQILHAKLRFFNTTPLGRIVNRFLSDMETIDQNVTPSASYLLYSVITTSYAIMLVSYVMPLFLISGFFIALIFWGIDIYYLHISHTLKRLNSTSCSLIYMYFAETIIGVSIICTFGAQAMLYL